MVEETWVVEKRALQWARSRSPAMAAAALPDAVAVAVVVVVAVVVGIAGGAGGVVAAWHGAQRSDVDIALKVVVIAVSARYNDGIWTLCPLCPLCPLACPQR